MLQLQPQCQPYKNIQFAMAQDLNLREESIIGKAAILQHQGPNIKLFYKVIRLSLF